MAQNLPRCAAHYIVILIVFIGHGDGRWREKDKETFKHDIELYRRMAEKIERDIETFYNEYPEERLEEDKIDSIPFKDFTNKLKSRLEMTTENNIVNNIKPNSSTTFTDINKDTEYSETKLKEANKSIEPELEWPKFEDILLEIGKKYDWKNDRWIKVRQKFKTKLTQNKPTENHIFQEKHKFSYKIVKLNRNKSRRSIIVAVSAVR